MAIGPFCVRNCLIFLRTAPLQISRIMWLFKYNFRMKEEVTSVLKQTQNLPNADKLATLKGQADQLLKMLKNDIVKGVSVADKGYGQRLDTISSEIGDFKARTGR